MSETLRVDAGRLKRFTQSVFVASGSPTDEAALVSGHLIQANLMGYDSHGVIRICQYVADVKKGRIVPGAPITLNNQTDTTAIVDCGWNFGQVGGYRALQCAIEKAQTHQHFHRGNTSAAVTRVVWELTLRRPRSRDSLPWGSATLRREMATSSLPGEDGKGVSPPIPCLSQCRAEQSRPFWAISRRRRLQRENLDYI